MARVVCGMSFSLRLFLSSCPIHPEPFTVRVFGDVPDLQQHYPALPLYSATVQPLLLVWRHIPSEVGTGSIWLYEVPFVVLYASRPARVLFYNGDFNSTS
ncbi:hypothetical protein IW261DRAFT_1540938 [Armillaria novae-zelandiae]|uniref:Uncharacterized protein n=1 Tax=Armillaria novae-zelandiae TaxID=153914 RepID=A0AA39N5W0_9AGAR|nr:hypothetical protein IW261DRAFT_1540938 [Armillaria novae-zelandiae]